MRIIVIVFIVSNLEFLFMLKISTEYTTHTQHTSMNIKQQRKSDAIVAIYAVQFHLCSGQTEN